MSLRCYGPETGRARAKAAGLKSSEVHPRLKTCESRTPCTGHGWLGVSPESAHGGTDGGSGTGVYGLGLRSFCPSTLGAQLADPGVRIFHVLRGRMRCLDLKVKTNIPAARNWGIESGPEETLFRISAWGTLAS